MKEIHLTQGYVALVDDEDFDYLNHFNWRPLKCRHTVYAIRCTRNEKGSRTHISMHKDLMGYTVTDHINHNGLDNRKSNLRPCNPSQNGKNKRKNRTDTSSKFKGVFWNKLAKKWKVRVRSDGNDFHCVCSDEILAAKIYNVVAEHMHGEFAHLNEFE